MAEFGPPRHHHRAHYPFVRLVNDGIWELQGKRSLDSRRDWTDTILVKNRIRGGFKEEIYSVLKEDKKLIRELIEMLLEQNFPNTVHEDIVQAVGLDFGLNIVTKRDPKFRGKILKAYEYRCAICGFYVRLGQTLVGLEAAHIKWHQAGGPDIEGNGLALCTMHHKLFDRGVFTIDSSMQFRVSETAYGVPKAFLSGS